MAITVLHGERKASQELMQFLCREAGVDHLNVREISVSVKGGELAQWDIKTVGGSKIHPPMSDVSSNQSHS